MTQSIAPIYAFSSLIISMITFAVYIGVMWLLACAVMVPLAGVFNKFKRVMDGPKHL